MINRLDENILFIIFDQLSKKTITQIYCANRYLCNKINFYSKIKLLSSINQITNHFQLYNYLTNEKHKCERCDEGQVLMNISFKNLQRYLYKCPFIIDECLGCNRHFPDIAMIKCKRCKIMFCSECVHYEKHVNICK